MGKSLIFVGGGRGKVGVMGVGALLSLSGIGREVGWGGRLFEAGRLLTFSAFRMGAYSRLGAYSNKYGKFLIIYTSVLL